MMRYSPEKAFSFRSLFKLRRSARKPRPEWCTRFALPALEWLEDRFAPTISITNVGTGSGTANVNTFPVNVTQAVPVNDTVLVSLAAHQDSNNAISVTDSKGNTYTLDANVDQAGTVRTLVFSAPVT